MYPGELIIFAPFLEKNSFDRAAGRFADCLFASKHSKADMLLTTVLGPLRSRWCLCTSQVTKIQVVFRF